MRISDWSSDVCSSDLLGKPNRIVNAYDERQAFGLTGAGLVPRIPFIEPVLMIDKRVLDLDMAPQTVLSNDKLRLVVGAFARFQIVDPLRMYQTVANEGGVAVQRSDRKSVVWGER